MAQQKVPISRLPPTRLAVTKKRKSEEEKSSYKKIRDAARAKTRVNIGTSFERWRELRENLGLTSDSDVAAFLLDSYDKDRLTPTNQHSTMRPPPATQSLSHRDDDSSIARVQQKSVEQWNASVSSLDLNIDVDEFNDIRNSIIDWEDEDGSWNPDAEHLSTLEEDESIEVDSWDDDSDDADFMPRLCVRTGGALKTGVCLESLPEISIEDTVHDPPDDTSDMSQEDMPGLETKVLVEDDVIGHPACIAYHDSLKQLAQYLILPISMCSMKDQITEKKCQEAGPFEINIKSRGTAAVIEWLCPRGHIVWKWMSQPILKFGMLVGDFMLSTNILLSGNDYAKISLLLKFINMGTVTRPTFFKIQDAYCLDTIKDFWEEKRSRVISQLKSEGPVVALGDGRMDSPGFCAQYCTYMTMDNNSKQIIFVTNLDKRETNRNSVIMEKEGFMRAFETLREELPLAEFCTDAHSQISALFNKGKYKDFGVRHSLDMWHGSKCLGEKIHTAGQQKHCTILLMWSKDVCNHFWYCCKTADTYRVFHQKWVAILHHVTGEHTWALGACEHGPLMGARDKEWIQRGSVAHQRLKEIILDPRWLKGVHKFLQFRSTAELESFHNHILMYASKRFSFTPPVYAARVLLASLDYNHHIDRPAKRRADGAIQYAKAYNKKSRKWSLHTIKVNKDYTYIADLQRSILHCRLSSMQGLPQTTTCRPGNLREQGCPSGIPAPSTQGL